MTAPTLGLRERKKEATRQALHEAAVRLAVEHGLEGLTVEAIADAADVSRRTFSNYFANKEEALLHSDQVRLRRLLDLLRNRPPQEPTEQALAAAARELVAGDTSDPGWLAQVRLLRRHQALVARQVAQYADAERALADLVAERLPPDDDRPLRARLLAAGLLTTMRVAVQHWIEDPSSSLPEVLDRALSLPRSTP
jgi:AcrR family transcriptional regulator